jgi:hypothetical protein
MDLSSIVQRLPLIMWILFTTYIALLPMIADEAQQNDDTYSLTNGDALCNSAVQCTNGKVFEELTDSLAGCGCGEGVFGQASCPVGKWGYTIAGFSATPFATSLLLALSAYPLLSFWGSGKGPSLFGGSELPKQWMHTTMKNIVNLWLLHYLMLYGGTFCTFSNMHEVVHVLFCSVGGLYFAAVAVLHALYFLKEPGAILRMLVASVASLSFIAVVTFGMIYKDANSNDWEYMPWLFEGIALASAFALNPRTGLVSTRVEEEAAEASTVPPTLGIRL